MTSRAFGVVFSAALLAIAGWGAANGAGGKSPAEQPGSSPHQPLSVSLIQLIATPESFDGRYVQAYGFITIEHEGTAIYLHREDAEHMLTKNGLWLAANDAAPAGSNEAQVKDRYSLVEGRFTADKKGHMGLWSGSIEEITRMEPWQIRNDTTVRPNSVPFAGTPDTTGEKLIPVVVTGKVEPAVVQEGEPIPLVVTIDNGLEGVVRFHTYGLKSNAWNGETTNLTLVDIYRDEKPGGLFLARPQVETPARISGMGAYSINEGESLTVTTDARKWKIVGGWVPGKYQVNVRVDSLTMEEGRCILSVYSAPFEFEIR